MPCLSVWSGCPLSAQISAQIEEAVASYPDADLTAHITVGSMDEGKLQALVSDLKAQRRENAVRSSMPCLSVWSKRCPAGNNSPLYCINA